jgi:N-acetyl-gamma-glutamyl-phosphate reductase
MTQSVFIDGAAGTTGLEIADRLAGRSEFELIILDDGRRKDSAARQEALQSADFAVLCLHDDAAREAVTLAQGSKVRIIDASTAHRVADGWTYGFPEIVGREAVAQATRVANPGCYPTGFIALVAPLVRSGLLPADFPYTVNAVSGYSGGGKGLIERFEVDTDIAFRTYGLAMGHKHVPEMTRYAGLVHPRVCTQRDPRPSGHGGGGSPAPVRHGGRGFARRPARGSGGVLRGQPGGVGQHRCHAR